MILSVCAFHKTNLPEPKPIITIEVLGQTAKDCTPCGYYELKGSGSSNFLIILPDLRLNTLIVWTPEQPVDFLNTTMLGEFSFRMQQLIPHVSLYDFIGIPVLESHRRRGSSGGHTLL